MDSVVQPCDFIDFIVRSHTGPIVASFGAAHRVNVHSYKRRGRLRWRSTDSCSVVLRRRMFSLGTAMMVRYRSE